jgi:hypothetical protein
MILQPRVGDIGGSFGAMDFTGVDDGTSMAMELEKE